MLAEAVLPCLRDGRAHDAVAIGREARTLAPTGGAAALVADILCGAAHWMTGGGAEARDLIAASARAAGPTASRLTDPHLRLYLAFTLRLTGDGAAARTIIEAVIEEARTTSAPGVLPYALARSAAVDLEAGRWAAAASSLAEAVTLAEALGSQADLGIALGAQAWLDAAQGRVDACRANAARSLTIARSVGPGSQLDMMAGALGLLELGCGEPSDAVAQLAEPARLAAAQGFVDAALQPHRTPDLVEALVRSGRTADARDMLAPYLAEAERIGHPSGLATGLRVVGLLADDDAFDEPFGQAIELSRAAPFDQARARLCFGERLRRTRRRVEAREQFRLAAAVFTDLGATPWRERAEAELRAAGDAGRRTDPTTRDDLTPAEHQIALLVADGGSNKAIAARLFVTPKTVEFHLSNVYRKLGVRSRTELARVIR